MLKNSKEEDFLVRGLKDFKSKNNRPPSLRELADYVSWKKSKVERTIMKLVAKGVLAYDTDAEGKAISKSLKIV